MCGSLLCSASSWSRKCSVFVYSTKRAAMFVSQRVNEEQAHHFSGRKRKGYGWRVRSFAVEEVQACSQMHEASQESHSLLIAPDFPNSKKRKRISSDGYSVNTLLQTYFSF